MFKSPQRRAGRPTTAMTSLAVAALSAFALTACGGGESDTASADTTNDSAEASASASASEASSADGDGAAMEGMEGMEGMEMGDPDATPANKIKGADLKEGTFTVLDTAPPGSDGVKGTAWLAQHDDGTTVTVMLTGLAPGTDYISHLHEQTCAKDNGGDHFQFEEGGATTPPNEVHLAFTSDKDGMGMMTVNNAGKVGDGAKAIVVHPAAAMDNKLACADF